MEENFIEMLEQKYAEEKNKLLYCSNSFSYYCHASISINGKKNEFFELKHFIDKSNGHNTQILYTKNNTRIYYSDVDLLEMLLQIDDENIRGCVLKAFMGRLDEKNQNGKVCILNKEFIFDSIGVCRYSKVLLDPQGLEISLEELMYIINFVIAKDAYVSKNSRRGYQFDRRTINKYIVLLRWYWYKELLVKDLLSEIGYNVNDSIRANYEAEDHEKVFKMNMAFESIQLMGF